MPQVRLTEQAVSDIARLTSFYRKNSEKAYREAVKALREAIGKIRKYPEIGRPCLEYPPYREWVIPFGSSGFIFLYVVSEKECLILAAKHQSELEYASTAFQ